MSDRKRVFKSGRTQAVNKAEARYGAAVQAIGVCFGLSAQMTEWDIRIIDLEVRPMPHLPKWGGDSGEVWGFRIVLEGPAEHFRPVRNDRTGLDEKWKAKLGGTG